MKTSRGKRKLQQKSYEHYGKAEQEERNALVLDLANKIWSPSTLDAYR